MINLVKDTIDSRDIDQLAEWLKTYPRLTKGELTIEFEKRWSNWLDTKYSVFINSGSSANLAIFYALILSGRLRNKKIILPSISWVTTISPAIQFGLEPILCDTDQQTLGLDIDHLEHLFKTENPSAVMLVHVLGIPNKMNEILDLCKKYDVILLEDSCESVGSTYYGTKTGNFGLASSFSFYFGHHLSTIEGGMICTNDEEFYNILLSIRSHGWIRDLMPEYQEEWLRGHNISEFKKMYTFIYPGFNLRSTDLQAFLGINQMNKLDMIVSKRHINYELYKNNIQKNELKIKDDESVYISNFAYPIVSENAEVIVQELKKNQIETRPLIAGNIANQPFWVDIYGKQKFPNADKIDMYGFYVPNNHEMNQSEILFVCDVINSI